MSASCPKPVSYHEYGAGLRLCDHDKVSSLTDSVVCGAATWSGLRGTIGKIRRWHRSAISRVSTVAAIQSGRAYAIRSSRCPWNGSSLLARVFTWRCVPAPRNTAGSYCATSPSLAPAAESTRRRLALTRISTIPPGSASRPKATINTLGGSVSLCRVVQSTIAGNLSTGSEKNIRSGRGSRRGTGMGTDRGGERAADERNCLIRS